MSGSYFCAFAKSINYRYSELRHQRIIGPPCDVSNSMDFKGSEIFISRLPNYVFLDTLYAIFKQCGRIYQIRIMVTDDLSGNNGLAYISYFSEDSAIRAINYLNFYEILPGYRIKVEKSLDNRRLYIGGIPQTKLRDEIWKELVNQGMRGIVDVIIYRSYTNPAHNRGFAFVEFENHKTAAATIANFQNITLFSKPVAIDWSVPVAEVSSDVMLNVSCDIFAAFQ